MDCETIQFLSELAIAFVIAGICFYFEHRIRQKRKTVNSNSLHVYLTMRNAKVEKAWRNMEKQNGETSPFLYFDYMKCIFQCTARKLSVFPMIVCVESPAGEILMIAPVKRYIFSGKLKMLGDTQGCGQTDFLFKPGLSEKEINRCISLFMHKYEKKLHFNRINEKSMLNSYFAEQNETNILSSQWPCVRITFTDNIDIHIKGLSPSVRQNLRTAYNRMKRDGIEYELKIWLPENTPEHSNRRKLTKLYLQRLLGKYKNRKAGNLLYKSYKTIYYKYIKHDSLSLRKLSNAFHAALFVRGECMCFMGGFANHEETRVVIPRLAINDTYKFYSPGYLLICETMKWLASNTAIREIDLSRGTEKYKIDLGGELYYTYSYVFASSNPPHSKDATHQLKNL